MRTFLLGLLGLGLAGHVHALVLDFNSLEAGTLVSDQFESSAGVTFSRTGGATGVSHPVLFDTSQTLASLQAIDSNIATGDTDPDLFGPAIPGSNGPGSNWSGGNLHDPVASNSIGVGNVMIIQETDQTVSSGPDGDQIPFQYADDNIGGFITMTFSTPITAFRLDWIDLDDTNNYFFNITGRNSSDGVVTTSVDFTEFITSGSVFYDATIVNGDHFANRFPEINATDLSTYAGVGIVEFDEVEIEFGGSGGFANVDITPVPESSAFAFVLGLTGIAGALARRRRASAPV